MSTATALHKDPTRKSVTDLSVLALTWQSPSPAWGALLMKRREEVKIPDVKQVLGEILRIPVNDLAGEHNRLFGSSGTCPLDLAHFWTDNPFQQAARLADLAGFYKAFGVEVEEGFRPDALPAVLELLSWLVFKRQYAIDQGWSERADISSRALQALLAGFILPAFDGFERRLEEAVAWPIYGLLYQATKACVNEIQTEVGNEAVANA